MDHTPVPPTCVGREEELAWLDQHLAAAVGGAGRVALVSAEAGAGKSTLSTEFLERVAVHHPEVLVVRATCSEQYGGGEPYQPFVEAFRTLLTPAGEGPRRRGIREIAKELAPHWVAAIPVAGELIAASMATATELRRTFGSAEGGTQAPSEDALFFQYTKLFFAAAEEQPILLFIDDLHWADRASVSLLVHLARRIREAPVLILGTLRPVDIRVSDHPLLDAKREMERYGVAEELELKPLAAHDLGELITTVLGAPAEPDLLNWLEKRAGTNALFFTELLHWLVQKGFAEERHGRWRLASRPEEVTIPRSAESTIEKRLDRLDPETYRILEYAAVQGNEFMSTTLARLLDMDELELEEQLEPLERTHHLIRLVETVDLPDGDFASLYVFAHSLVQGVLHAALKGKRRILLHRKVAQLLEELHVDDVETVSHKLAVHCDEGRLPEKAFGFALQAADRASRVYAHWDALELVLRAERNAPDELRRAEALERRGDIQLVVGRVPNAMEAMREALALVESAGDEVAALPLRRKILLLEEYLGDRPHREIAVMLRQNAEEARRLGAKEQLCEILWYLVDLEETDRSEDLELATEALGLAVELGSPRLLAKGHNALGLALTHDGSPDDAAPQFQEALRRYEELDDLAGVGRCSNCLAIGAIMAGNTQGALDAFERARAAFQKVGEPLLGALVLNNLAVLIIRTGQLDRAESLLQEALDVWNRLDASHDFLCSLQNLAEIAELRLDWPEAEQRWRRLRDQAFQLGAVDAAVIAESGLGRVRLQRGDLAGARAQLQAAKRRMETRESWSEAAEATYMLEALLAAAEGDTDASLRLLAEAEEALRGADRYTWAVFRTERARVLRLAGQTAAAEQAASEAIQTFNELGAELMAARAGDLLGDGAGAWSGRSRAAS